MHYNMNIKVSPSILSADFGKLNEEVASIEPESDILHVDITDGEFVPNISFGAPVMKWVKTQLPQDYHLMTVKPWRYFDDFVKAGADRLIVHVEACDDLRGVLGQIIDAGAKPGVAIKPATSAESIKGVLDLLDYVLVMTVEPGFSGQSFMANMVPKMQQIRDMGFAGDMGPDGGIDDVNAKICAGAGANVMAAASYVFNAEDRLAALRSLRG